MKRTDSIRRIPLLLLTVLLIMMAVKWIAPVILLNIYFPYYQPGSEWISEDQIICISVSEERDPKRKGDSYVATTLVQFEGETYTAEIIQEGQRLISLCLKNEDGVICRTITLCGTMPNSGTLYLYPSNGGSPNQRRLLNGAERISVYRISP